MDDNNNTQLHFWQKNDISSYKRSLSIILLAHVQQPRGQINHSQLLQCNDTERFSIEEFNEIYQGIVEAGFFIQNIYFNELDFITEYIEHPEKFNNCLIYNLARNGLGNNKKTLIPAFCELIGLNYSTSGSLSCGLCRNKYYFTKLLNSHGIPTPNSWMLTNASTFQNDQMPSNGTVVISKPCSESASQGVNDSSIFNFTMKEIDRFNETNCLIQEYIEGAECEVPVLCINGEITAFQPVGIDLFDKKIIGEQESCEYTYGFYSLENTQNEITIELIKKYATETFKLLQMDVYGRIDFRIDLNGNPYVIDVSTTPYTTKHSSFAFAFSQLDLPYSEIYEAIITAALLRSNN